VERRAAFDLDPIESKMRQERFSVRTFPFLQQAALGQVPLSLPYARTFVPRPYGRPWWVWSNQPDWNF